MDANPNLEVFFCDLCNTSVPARDLETGAARRMRNRVLGACCLKDLVPGAAAAAARATPAWLPVFALVTLGAIAGGAIFIDWRLSEEVAGVSERVAGRLEVTLHGHADRLTAIEERLRGAADKVELGVVGQRLAEMRQQLTTSVERAEAAATGLEDLHKRSASEAEASGASRREVAQALERLEQAVRTVAADLAAVKAAPRLPQASEAAAEPDSIPMPGRVEPAPPAGLPKEVQHHIATLTDSDPGVRFQAVAALIDSKHPGVREPLLGMVKDPDPFVRRQTMEGLRQFRHLSCVEALLTALADPEGIVRHTAYTSLKSLTGAALPFDPNGSKDERTAQQRRWREWWEENKKTFSG